MKKIMILSMLCVLPATMGMAENIADYARAGDWETVRSLAGQSGTDLNAKDCDGVTALMFASSEGNIDVVRELVSRGALVDAQDRRGNTPFVRAWTEIVALVSSFSKESSAYGQGDSSFVERLDEIEKLVKTAICLVENGADVNAQDNTGNTIVRFWLVYCWVSKAFIQLHIRSDFLHIHSKLLPLLKAIATRGVILTLGNSRADISEDGSNASGFDIFELLRALHVNESVKMPHDSADQSCCGSEDEDDIDEDDIC